MALKEILEKFEQEADKFSMQVENIISLSSNTIIRNYQEEEVLQIIQMEELMYSVFIIE